MRDDFSQAIKNTLAKRVVFHCSNPDCDRPTSGPASEEEKTVNVGIAAHITAAAPGGPRYDALLSNNERRALSNGIWLCNICAKLIDSDEKKFPVDRLRKWKEGAEKRAYNRAFSTSQSIPMVKTILQLDEDAREFLRSLVLPDAEEIEATMARMQSAAEKDIESFINTRDWPSYVIPLNLTLLNSESQFNVTLDGIANGVTIADTTEIVAPPGTGKTTTMIQMAQSILRAGQVIPVFIPLGEWSNRQETWFDFLARRNAFRSFTSQHFMQLAYFGRLTLLLDGWNELPPDAHRRANSDLRSLKREFPQLGIVIGTRQQPLPVYGISSSGAVLTIEALSDDQQMKLAKALCGEDGKALVDQAWRTPGVRELISVPLYLNALLTSTRGAAFPQTKETVLSSFIHEHESNPEKAGILRDELLGFHKNILIGLAVEANRAASTTFSDEEARSTISKVMASLQTQGQVATSPQPVKVLDVLVDTHLLIRSSSEIDNISFQHQQFQELYASFEVERLMLEVEQGNDSAKKSLHVRILNWLAWEESVLFACERLSRMDSTGITAVVNTILDTLSIDPMLAADMIYRSEAEVWKRLSDKVIEFIGQWHTSGTVDRAVRFMIITGQPEFSEQIWPLISDTTNKHYYEVLNIAPRFRPSVLGLQAEKRLAELPDTIRGRVIAEIAYRSGYDGIELASQLAKSDRSPTVVAEILQALQYRRATRNIESILQSASDDVLQLLVSQGFPDQLLNSSQRERFIQIHHAQIDSETSPIRKIALLLRDNVEDAENRICQLIQSPDFPMDNDQAQMAIDDAFVIHPKMVTEAMVQRLTNSLELPYKADEFLEQALPVDEGPIAAFALNQTTSKSIAHWVNRVIGSATIGKIMDEYIHLDEKSHTAGQRMTEPEREEYYRLQDAITASRQSSFLNAFLERANTDQPHRIQLFANLLARHGKESEIESLVLVDNEQTQLVATIERWIETLLPSSTTSRHQLAAVVQAIQRIPQPQFVSALHKMLERDLLDWARSREKQFKPGRGGSVTSDASHSYTLQYRCTFSAIGDENVIALMKSYLPNLEFGFDAACVLLDIWNRNHSMGKNKRPLSRPDFSEVKERRIPLQNSLETPPSCEFVDAIFEIVTEYGSTVQDDIKQKHALRLAPLALKMSYGKRHSEVETLLNLPQPYGQKSTLLTSLAVAGEMLSADILLAAVQELLELWEKEPWRQKEEHYKLMSWLELFAFSDRPLMMFKILDLVPKSYQRSHELDHLLVALSQSPHEEALLVLIELGQRNPEIMQDPGWFDALLELNTDASNRTLLDLIYEGKLKVDHRGISNWYLAQQLTKLLAKSSVLRNEISQQYEKLTNGPIKHLLETVLLETPDNIIIFAVIRNMAANNQPYDGRLSHAISKLAIGQRLDTDWPGIFEQFSVPLEDFRKQLLAMLPINNAQSILAKACLNEIEALRDEYGRINDEPRHPDIESNIPETFYLF